MASEDHDSEGEYQSVEDALTHGMVQYRVRYSHGRNTEKVDINKKEDINKKRCPVSRSGNNPGRLKRVVSCKRKTHHLTVGRRKQPGTGRSVDMANKENELGPVQDMQEIFYMDPWEFPPNVIQSCKTEVESPRNTDYFTEMTKDHNTMTEVLFGRNLRLTVAMTLWRRNIGELLTYLIRIQDTGVFVDFLPIITKSIKEESPNISIGCCVDLFPLVRKALTSPYEGYLIVGLRWVESVLKNWWEELATSCGSGIVNHPQDGNFQVFKQQLLDLWNQEPYLSLVPGTAGDIASDIDTYLSQLP